MFIPSVLNNTNKALQANQVWKGSPESCSQYNNIEVEIACDKPCVVRIYQGVNGMNWDNVLEQSIETPTTTITTKVWGKSFYVSVINGNESNTYLRLYTLLKT